MEKVQRFRLSDHADGPLTKHRSGAPAHLDTHLQPGGTIHGAIACSIHGLEASVPPLSPRTLQNIFSTGFGI